MTKYLYKIWTLGHINAHTICNFEERLPFYSYISYWLLHFLQSQKRKLLQIWLTLHMILTTIPFYARFVLSFLCVQSKLNCELFFSEYEMLKLLWSKEQLNVLELFLDCLTEPNEKLVEFGAGGICNSCIGELSNLNLFFSVKVN